MLDLVVGTSRRFVWCERKTHILALFTDVVFWWFVELVCFPTLLRGGGSESRASKETMNLGTRWLTDN